MAVGNQWSTPLIVMCVTTTLKVNSVMPPQVGGVVDQLVGDIIGLTKLVVTQITISGMFHQETGP
jgi:hypothetical protein